jgi:hypothetical protein
MQNHFYLARITNLLVHVFPFTQMQQLMMLMNVTASIAVQDPIHLVLIMHGIVHV